MPPPPAAGGWRGGPAAAGRSQWEKNERRLFCTKTIQNTLKNQVTCRIDTLSRNIVTGDPLSCRQGHFRSWKVTSSFSGIAFDRDQLER